MFRASTEEWDRLKDDMTLSDMVCLCYAAYHRLRL